jgi:hypothetical protein
MSIDADRITSLVREVRLALRRLSRDAGLFVTTVTTMAIGIGVVASVFALVEGVLLRPLPYPDPDRLVSVRHVAPGFELTRSGVSAGVFLHYRDRSRVFEGLAAYEVASHTLADGGASERIQHALHGDRQGRVYLRTRFAGHEEGPGGRPRGCRTLTEPC